MAFYSSSIYLLNLRKAAQIPVQSFVLEERTSLFFYEMARDTEENVEPVKLFFVCNTPKSEEVISNLSPIIFIPGLFSTNRTFVGVKYDISRRTKRKVYTLDLRNHGKSDYSNSFSLLHLVADLENFMDSEKISKAILAGHSMGGRLALAMALKHPDKIEKIIVEDIPLVSTAKQNDEFLKTFIFVRFLHKKLSELPSAMSVKQAQEKLIPFVAKYWPMVVKNFSAANSKFALPFHKDATGQFKWEMNMDVVLETQNHMDRLALDLSNEPVYRDEVLLLAGGKSVFRVQDKLEDFDKHFPNFDCMIFEEGFHTYHVEYPELYTKIVSKFIGEKGM